MPKFWVMLPFLHELFSHLLNPKYKRKIPAIMKKLETAGLWHTSPSQLGHMMLFSLNVKQEAFNNIYARDSNARLIIAGDKRAPILPTGPG